MADIGTAYVQIEPTAKGISKKIEGEFSGAGSASGKTFSGAFSGALGAVGGVVLGVGKVAAGAVAAAGTAVAGLTKSAVDSFADYEQLVGGVETLFKNSSGKVKIYAAQAYETAGLSANEYMEQVTSFSASLLQGLNGNTNKAADVANIAIKDMADNVNKMGTTQEAVQNAYNGLAKQNFMMLDNLKLGYQGTAGEMARLINDSGVMGETFKATAKNVKDISFDKYIEAIHVIQEEMGITGTTANEAATTISGSTAMMQASWANLVTGIANDKVDFGTLVDNFVSSFETAFNNIMPRIEVTLSGVADLITKIAPVITERLPDMINQIVPPLIEAVSQVIHALAESLPGLLPVLTNTITGVLPDIINAIVEILPLLVDTAVQIIGAIAQGIIDNLPALLDAAIQIITSLADDIIKGIPQLIPALVDTMIAIVDTLIDNVDMLIDAAIEIILALADGIIANLPKLLDKTPEVIAKFVMAIIRNAPKLLEAALSLVVKLAEGIVMYWTRVITIIPDCAKKIIEKFKETDWKSIGDNIIQGIKDGFLRRLEDLFETVRTSAKKILETAKNILQIGSPSKLFADEIGRWIPEGIAVGIEANADSVTGSIDNLVNDSIGITPKINAIASNAAYSTGGARYNEGNMLSEIAGLLNKYMPYMGRPIVLDTGALVGQTAAMYDGALGKIQTRNNIR